MLPTTFEFRWDAGHMIFFGLFYAVVAVVLTSLFFVAAKSVTDVYRTMKSGEPPQSGERPGGSGKEEEQPGEGFAEETPEESAGATPAVAAKT